MREDAGAARVVSWGARIEGETRRSAARWSMRIERATARVWGLGVVLAGALGCGGVPDGTGSEASAGDRVEVGEMASGARHSQTVRGADGELRRAFLGGAFVTRNTEMPVEIDQAIAGEVTDHPVVVWAGD
jgi:hypothetical protein